MVIMCCKQLRCYLKLILFLGLVVQGTVAVADSIVGSKHDLSTAGGVDEICVFCHTPHDANADLDNDGNDDVDHATRPSAPLWNRRITDMGTYSMYTSDTLNSDCDATPSPLSLVCLSCHDAAANISMGGVTGDDGAVDFTDSHSVVNEPNRGKIADNCGKACHQLVFGTRLPVWWQIGPDLSNDHPISMPYPTPAEDPDFFIPPDSDKGWSDVKLFNGRVECPSCHNPHDPANLPFLRKTMANSELCTTCHNK